MQGNRCATRRGVTCPGGMRALILVMLFGCAMGGKKSASAPMMYSRVAGTSASEPVVARRTADNVSWRDITVVNDAAESPEPQDISGDAVAMKQTSQQSGTTTGTTTPATTAEAPLAKDPEKLVVEAWLQMTTTNVGKTVELIRTRVEASGGRMITENINGSESSASSASLEFRIPPAQANAVATWLGTLGTITHKTMKATEVSKTLFDQELALKNLDITMTRLQALAEKGGPIDLVLKVEQELTRVRGEIEQIKGEHRYLLDRVAYAT